MKFCSKALLLVATLTYFMTKEANAIYLPDMVCLYRGEGSPVDSVNGISLEALGEGFSYTDETPYGTRSRQVFWFDGGGKAKGSPIGLPSGSEPRTIIGWFKRDTAWSGNNGPFGYGLIEVNKSYYLRMVTHENYSLELHQTLVEENMNPFLTNIDAIWYHVAVTYNGSHNTAYVNGEKVASAVPNAVPDTTGSNVIVGGNMNSGTEAWNVFKGYVADFAVFDRALTDGEVLSVYQDTDDGLQASFSPSITPTMTPPRTYSWFISNTDDVTEEATSSEIITIQLPFNSSHRDIGVEVFRKDCVTSFDTTDYPYFVPSLSIPTSSQADGFVQFNATLAMNITAINGTGFFNTFTSGRRGGWAEACIETSLMFKDDVKMGNAATDEKVTFKNNILNISVSLTATYDVDEVNVVREAATEEKVNTDYSNFITAYECNEADIYTKAATTTYNQGDEITICVVDESTGIVQVEEFVDLIGTQSGLTNYNFIRDGKWNPDITTPVCTDGPSPSKRRVCYAKVRALARFFSSESPPDLTMSGSIYVIRDGRRVMRRLHTLLPAPEMSNEEKYIDASRRRMKEENGNGDFEVTTKLGSVNSGPASDVTVERTVAGLLLMVFGAAGIALMV